MSASVEPLGEKGGARVKKQKFIGKQTLKKGARVEMRVGIFVDPCRVALGS